MTFEEKSARDKFKEKHEFSDKLSNPDKQPAPKLTSNHITAEQFKKDHDFPRDLTDMIADANVEQEQELKRFFREELGPVAGALQQLENDKELLDIDPLPEDVDDIVGAIAIQDGELRDEVSDRGPVMVAPDGWIADTTAYAFGEHRQTIDFRQDTTTASTHFNRLQLVNVNTVRQFAVDTYQEGAKRGFPAFEPDGAGQGTLVWYPLDADNPLPNAGRFKSVGLESNVIGLNGFVAAGEIANNVDTANDLFIYRKAQNSLDNGRTTLEYASISQMMDTARGTVETILGVGTDTNDKFWIQGDNKKTCYGINIGAAAPSGVVINLNTRELVQGADTSDTSVRLDWQNGYLQNHDWQHLGTSRHFRIRGTDAATDSESGAFRVDGGMRAYGQSRVYGARRESDTAVLMHNGNYALHVRTNNDGASSPSAQNAVAKFVSDTTMQVEFCDNANGYAITAGAGRIHSADGFQSSVGAGADIDQFVGGGIVVDATRKRFGSVDTSDYVLVQL